MFGHFHSSSQLLTICIDLLCKTPIKHIEFCGKRRYFSHNVQHSNPVRVAGLSHAGIMRVIVRKPRCGERCRKTIIIPLLRSLPPPGRASVTVDNLPAIMSRSALEDHRKLAEPTKCCRGGKWTPLRGVWRRTALRNPPRQTVKCHRLQSGQASTRHHDPNHSTTQLKLKWNTLCVLLLHFYRLCMCSTRRQPVQLQAVCVGFVSLAGED